MTPRLTPERVRELLAAATPGPWEVSPVEGSTVTYGDGSVPAAIKCLCVADCDDAEIREVCDVACASDADAALIAAAPDLAADALALHDALARVTRERDAAVAARDALVTAVRAYLAAVDSGADATLRVPGTYRAALEAALAAGSGR